MTVRQMSKQETMCETAVESYNLPTAAELDKMNLLQLMEIVIEHARDCKLSDDFFQQIAPVSTRLGNRLQISPSQAVFYSLFIDNYDKWKIDMQDLCNYTGARIVRFAQYQEDIDVIEEKRYIHRSNSHNYDEDSGVAYEVPTETLEALRKNRPYAPKRKRKLSFNVFMHEMDKLRYTWHRCGQPYYLFAEDAITLAKDNMHLKVAQRLVEQRERIDEEDEWALLVSLTCIEMFHSKRLELTVLNRLFGDDRADMLAMIINNGISQLQRDKLIEYAFVDGVVDKNSITLTRKATKQLLCENKHRYGGDGSSMVEHKAIAAKHLYYDKKVEAQVNDLTDLLSIKSFKQICRRLKQHGMRQGFACLFYGAPGTGKTETVLQLAKQTGRDIMQVDFSQLKDKYVGETEKNVKALFDEYRAAAEGKKVCPILLFNEADAIIGKRLDKVEHSVDSMHNSIQNIILQEMENFEGILIATTNLETNMDSAFERRFLYKVRFEKPTPAVRKEIWKSAIPALTDGAALNIAKEHDFSGGQIENIARKLLVDSILYGESGNLYGKVQKYCHEENIQNRKARPAIGFSHV